jgi:hypothetical protein
MYRYRARHDDWLATGKPSMPTETPAAQKFVKVALNYKQVALLFGVTDIYSKRYIQSLEEKLKLARSEDEEKDLVYKGVTFYAAATELSRALVSMLEEGAIRADHGNFDSYEVLFTPPEAKFLSTIVGTGEINTSEVVASGKYTEEDAQNAKALIAELAKSLAAGVELTPDQVEALRADAAAKAAADNGFQFAQTKVGLA